MQDCCQTRQATHFTDRLGRHAAALYRCDCRINPLSMTERKLKGPYVAPPRLLLLLYKSMIQSILLYCSACFYDRLSVRNKAELTCITARAAKIIRLPTPNLTDLKNQAITFIATSIGQDVTHPLNIHLIAPPQDADTEH